MKFLFLIFFLSSFLWCQITIIHAGKLICGNSKNIKTVYSILIEKNIVIDATNQLLLQGKHIILGNADKTTSDVQIIGRKIEINASKEVKVTGASKISKDSKNLFLKSSLDKTMNPLLKVAFIPGQFKVGPGLRNLTLGDV